MSRIGELENTVKELTRGLAAAHREIKHLQGHVFSKTYVGGLFGEREEVTLNGRVSAIMDHLGIKVEIPPYVGPQVVIPPKSYISKSKKASKK